jgi:large subunit ribosomal protein L24
MTAIKKPKFKVKKGDTVVVLAGKDKGKTGEIIRLVTADNKVVVRGVNVLTKHKKPSQTSPGGIEKTEAPIHISNVALVDPKTKKATRVGYKTVGDKKVRIARGSGETID